MKLKDVIIRDWMTADVIIIAPDTAISEAHKIMKSNNIRRLPVVEGEKLVRYGHNRRCKRGQPHPMQQP